MWKSNKTLGLKEIKLEIEKRTNKKTEVKENTRELWQKNCSYLSDFFAAKKSNKGINTYKKLFKSKTHIFYYVIF